MSDTRSFYATNLNIPGLIQALKDWFEFQDYEIQALELPGGDRLLQVRQGGAWRNMLGLTSALNIVMRQRGETLAVEIGAGKWADKAIVGTISLFVLWPLALTAAYGTWRQSQLPQRTFEFIQNFIYAAA